jgi:hypothetical protein
LTSWGNLAYKFRLRKVKSWVLSRKFHCITNLMALLVFILGSRNNKPQYLPDMTKTDNSLCKWLFSFWLICYLDFSLSKCYIIEISGRIQLGSMFLKQKKNTPKMENGMITVLPNEKNRGIKHFHLHEILELPTQFSSSFSANTFFLTDICNFTSNLCFERLAWWICELELAKCDI